MKFNIIAVASALCFQAAWGAVIGDKPLLGVRSSCQLGSIGPANAGDAACSASCFAQHGDIHGGHCDENAVCVCN